MNRPRILAKKPLIEAMLELRWTLEPGSTPETKRDPNYKFLLGTLFQSVQKQYPLREELPAAQVPDEMVPHIVQYRFRPAAQEYPVLQVGPGVFTVNETTNYEWSAFEQRLLEAIPLLFKAYPAPDALRVELLMLRFINVFPFQFTKQNVLEFLSRKLRTVISLPESIFSDVPLGPAPLHLATDLIFPCNEPQGAMQFKLQIGNRDNREVFVFDLAFLSRGGHVPSMPGGFGPWLSGAHAAVETSFFRLVEGDLLKEFSGDA